MGSYGNAHPVVAQPVIVTDVCLHPEGHTRNMFKSMNGLLIRGTHQCVVTLSAEWFGRSNEIMA